MKRSSLFFSILRVANSENSRLFSKAVKVHDNQLFKVLKNPSSTSFLGSKFFSQSRPYGTDIQKDVKVVYRSGLPVISVPLPSRHEACSFTLRPVSSTVGDFLASLKQEDKGIDRTHIYATDGSRIASDTPIEHLLKDNFVLVINEDRHEVAPPVLERLSSEEVAALDNVKALISQLYGQLNLDQHQLSKERELLSRLEQLKEARKPLEEMRGSLTRSATRRTRVLMWAGLAAMATQFGLLARLTWWEYSWDIMEPVTYFITYGTAIIMYGYFVLTQQEYIYPDARDRQYLRFFHKEANKTSFDIERYNSLCDEIAEAEQDLKRLRDPLQLQLPIESIRTEKMKELNRP